MTSNAESPTKRSRAIYTKLFSSILDSSIWGEPHPTRLVWITMLAMADEFGIVHASAGGLARRAVVTPEECKRALETLEAPDIESKSQEWGGRRIEPVDGGWQILNHKRYREIRTRRQVQDAARQRRHRDRSRDSVTSNDVTTRSRSRGRSTTTSAQGAGNPKKPSWSSEACDDWKARFEGTAPGGRIGKALKPLVEQHGWDKIRPIWQKYLAKKDAEFASPQDFASKLSLWIGENPDGIDNWLATSKEAE